MYKEMVAMAVCTNNQQIEIKQPQLDGGDHTIYLPVEQVDLLVKWIAEAKDELTTAASIGCTDRSDNADSTEEYAIPNG